MTVATEGRLTWAVSFRGRPLLRPSRIAMTLADGRVLGASPVVSGTTTRSQDQVLRPVVRTKRAEVRDRYNERRVDFTGDFSLIVRAYDDGVAYRFVTRLPGDITVRGEDATLAFTGDHLLYFPEETSFLSHQEREYKKLKITEITPGRFSSACPRSSCRRPVRRSRSPRPTCSTTRGWTSRPGRRFTASRGLFPAYPRKVELNRDRNERVVEREDYIARTRGTREFPWRVLVVAERDEDLIDSDIVYRLASESHAGRYVLDQAGQGGLGLVEREQRLRRAVPRRRQHRDLQALHRLRRRARDRLRHPGRGLVQARRPAREVVPGIDMEALAAHAKTAKRRPHPVGGLEDAGPADARPALDQFARWGVKGIKVDFMQREDQWMVNYYERVAREAAKRRLLVDFHGAYKPTGLYRTWPNVVTSEGVLGLEQSKWSDLASPDNAVTFPFMRMLAGPVDYTPGAMMNATRADFQPIFNRPMSQGTRCHQLAMYVVFESPLQMLADSPSNYRKEPESLAFLSAVPVVWDETRVLGAKVGEHILVARRSGRDWYVAALTNWVARDLDVDLSFLGTGSFQADVYRDGPNADRVGVDYVLERRNISAGDRLRVHLAPGGGLAVRLTPR